MEHAIKENIKRLKEEVLAEIYDNHLIEFVKGKGKVFKISGDYPGVWLEHAYDGVAWGDYEKNSRDVSLAQINLFLDAQKEDGQVPFFAGIDENDKLILGYSQIQECVAFATKNIRLVKS